jgi:hypothetical protein
MAVDATPSHEHVFLAGAGNSALAERGIMATRGFLPDKDTQLLAWSLNFKTLITAAPTTYGLTSTMATAYTALHTAFATALEACDPGVRNKSAVAAKNTARLNLKTSARDLAKLVEGTSTVTDAQKIELGLNVRATPTPIPAPTVAPDIDIVSVAGNIVKIRLHDAETPGKRGKPTNVAGATVFTYVGAAAPTELTAWKFEGNTTKTEIDIAFDASLAPGTVVWFTAFWRNPRDLSGPACAPMMTRLQYGTVAMAA